MRESQPLCEQEIYELMMNHPHPEVGFEHIKRSLTRWVHEELVWSIDNMLAKGIITYWRGSFAVYCLNQ